MIRQLASSWSARSTAGHWEGEASSASCHLHVEVSSHRQRLVKGLLRRSLHGLPLQYRPFLLPLKFKQRNPPAHLPRAASASSNEDSSPALSFEFFKLYRKKVVRPPLISKGDTRSRSPSALSDEATLKRKFTAEERDLSPGFFDFVHKHRLSGGAPGHEGVHEPPHSLSKLKKICSDGWEKGYRTLQASPLAPLLPYSSPLLASIAVALVIGIIVGRWIGKAASKRVQVTNAGDPQVVTSTEAKAPSGISLFLDVDMKKKETVEWVNMVLGKIWKVYRLGLENWLVGLLQPLIDNLQKPSYVRRVRIKRFDLGDEPLSIRSIERRTSRRVNDIQYHIGLRYTGGARMTLLLEVRAGFIPVTIPVSVLGLDVDGELWVKLRLVPIEPWVGAATWAFVSLPKIKLDLSPFRLFNLMAIPFLSVFLTQLLTQDLPRLFVRPNKNVVDFLQGKVVGPVPKDFKSASMESNSDFSGELTLTLVEARKLKYAPFGKTDPYVVLVLGDQVIKSKKNSQTSVIGPPGRPIWNQDFQLLVVDPKTQRLDVRVRDFFGLTAFTVGIGEVDLLSLQDTVPADKVVKLKGGWGPFRKRYAGEVSLRLTYTAYIDDEDEDIRRDAPLVRSRDVSSLEPSSMKDGVMEALPLVKEVIDTVVETVRVENPKMIEAVSSALNVANDGNVVITSEDLEDTANGGVVSTEPNDPWKEEGGGEEEIEGFEPRDGKVKEHVLKDKILVSTQADDADS